MDMATLNKASLQREPSLPSVCSHLRPGGRLRRQRKDAEAPELLLNLQEQGLGRSADGTGRWRPEPANGDLICR